MTSTPEPSAGVNNAAKKESKRTNLEDPSGQSRPNHGAAEGEIGNAFTPLASRLFWLLAAKSSDFDDPTSKIWAVYNSETAPFDKALIESWTKDKDGILIFVSFATWDNYSIINFGAP